MASGSQIEQAIAAGGQKIPVATGSAYKMPNGSIRYFREDGSGSGVSGPTSPGGTPTPTTGTGAAAASGAAAGLAKVVTPGVPMGTADSGGDMSMGGGGAMGGISGMQEAPSGAGLRPLGRRTYPVESAALAGLRSRVY